MLVDIQYERNDVDFHRGTFRVRGDVVEVFPAYERDTAVRIEFFGDEIEAITRGRPAARQGQGQRSSATRSSPARTTSRRRSRCASAIAQIREELRERLDFLRQGGALPREAAPRAAHALRPRDAGADGLLQRHRELLAPPLGPEAGRAAAHAHRLLPEGLPAHPRRVAPDGAADRRDVPRRPRAQGDARRVRLPPAERARQPAAQVRGVRGARPATCIYVSRHARRLRAREGQGRRRRADHPPDRPHRSGDRGAPRRRPGRRSARRDPRPRVEERARPRAPR